VFLPRFVHGHFTQFVAISLRRSHGNDAPVSRAFAKFREELVGQLLGRAVDQRLAELRQLAADLCLDMVAQQGSAKCRSLSVAAPPTDP
jgi:hypothetical protein